MHWMYILCIHNKCIKYTFCYEKNETLWNSFHIKNNCKPNLWEHIYCLWRNSILFSVINIYLIFLLTLCDKNNNIFWRNSHNHTILAKIWKESRLFFKYIRSKYITTDFEKYQNIEYTFFKIFIYIFFIECMCNYTFPFHSLHKANIKYLKNLSSLYLKRLSLLYHFKSLSKYYESLIKKIK